MPNTTLLKGDCLEVLPTLPADSVSMCFCDLPYGVTANRWDTVIPLSDLWAELLRVGKKNAAYVFTATQPFATALINSQPKLFRYDLVWEKTKATGFVHANHMPLRCHELVWIFSRAKPYSPSNFRMIYNPQKTFGKPYHNGYSIGSNNNFTSGMKGAPNVNLTGERHPRSVLRAIAVSQRNQHPTQKPVALLEWLIKTYSNPGDLVLDPAMGSATAAVACINTGRRFIGIEKDAGYFETCQKRVADATAQMVLV